MDLATLVGFVVAVGIIIAAMIMGGGVMPFVDVPSMAVVGGGTFGAVMMQYNFGQFVDAIKAGLKALLYKAQAPSDVIVEIVDMAKETRTGGLLILEEKEPSSEFLAKGVAMLVDGMEADVVTQTLVAERNRAATRHDDGAAVFSKIAEVAPAMGMIGTLVGLVLMLGNMDDPKSIGPAMAVALLTTLYGALIANVIASPLAGKLSLRRNEEFMLQSIIIDGISGMQEGRNPRVIDDMLRTYLPGSKRDLEGNDKEEDK
ncbi:MAG: MotA/TolQ/ExbB proton channel family protein [Porticoccaceae bacterium]|nr:MotA/TolQ/ExbB proton channel family protein [Porticoccaceae bacterium]